LDLKEGKIIETPNMTWKDAPLRAELEKALDKQVRIDNDGNVGVLGEYAFGAGKGAEHVIGLFVGTGIGGGIIVNGELLHGFNENAGELGHIILDPNGPQCGCGNYGCMEALASRLAIEREIRNATKYGITTSVFDGMENPDERLRSKRLAEAYRSDDPAVTAAINKSALYLGYGVASLINIFNPEVVVLGGGLVEAVGDAYVRIVWNVAKNNVFAVARRNIKVTAAELKDDSAVLGAAVLAWKDK
jgi:glucokinase